MSVGGMFSLAPAPDVLVLVDGWSSCALPPTPDAPKPLFPAYVWLCAWDRWSPPEPPTRVPAIPDVAEVTRLAAEPPMSSRPNGERPRMSGRLKVVEPSPTP